MVRKDTMRSRHLLTLLQDLRLSSNLPQSTNNLLIPIHKTAYRVWNLDVLTKLSNKMLRLAQTMARNPRKQVMNSLELQPPMEEIQPGWTIHIHSRAQHLLRK